MPLVSALHAMAILQVYQTRALKELHKGSSDPELMLELHSATNFTLLAMKVTAQALGEMMSTLLVQEHHLWLKLTEMWEVEKVRLMILLRTSHSSSQQ